MQASDRVIAPGKAYGARGRVRSQPCFARGVSLWPVHTQRRTNSARNGGTLVGVGVSSRVTRRTTGQCKRLYRAENPEIDNRTRTVNVETCARRPWIRTQFGGRVTFADPRQGDPARPQAQPHVDQCPSREPRPLHRPYGFLSRPCVIRLRVWRVMGLRRTRTRLRMASCVEGASQPASWEARISSC